jgi:hypothetical protein
MNMKINSIGSQIALVLLILSAGSCGIQEDAEHFASNFGLTGKEETISEGFSMEADHEVPNPGSAIPDPNGMDQVSIPPKAGLSHTPNGVADGKLILSDATAEEEPSAILGVGGRSVGPFNFNPEYESSAWSRAAGYIYRRLTTQGTYMYAEFNLEDGFSIDRFQAAFVDNDSTYDLIMQLWQRTPSGVTLCCTIQSAGASSSVRYDECVNSCSGSVQNNYQPFRVYFARIFTAGSGIGLRVLHCNVWDT